MQYKVLKFGGTSLGDAERIRAAAEIASQNEKCIVVCSAMAGITDKLINISQLWCNGNTVLAKQTLDDLKRDFIRHCSELFERKNHTASVFEYIDNRFKNAHKQMELFHSSEVVNQLLALGELITSYIFNIYLEITGVRSSLLFATDIIYLNKEGLPVVEDISKRMQLRNDLQNNSVFITQGYICRDSEGKMANLGRGGSDYTATLIGAATNADVIEIWTDIDGLHNNDPRHVENTLPVRKLSYEETAELAYFGAKILHPSCVRPAKEKNIPIILKNSMSPSSHGTIIHSKSNTCGIKAIAAKDDITILRITSGRMLNAHGFMKKLFEIFDTYKTSVDVVTTSEVSVSITFEDRSNLFPMLKAMNKLGRTNIETDRSIICIVGDMLHPGYVAEILSRIKRFDVRMISMGASSNNITIVLPQEQKVGALKALHNLFEKHQENKKNKHNSVLT